MSETATHAAYPRLEQEEALALVKDIAERPLTELRDEASTDLAGMSFYPMAVARVTEEDIREIQSAIRGIAGEHGYPEPASTKKKSTFDRALVAQILELMPMTPADAADEGVWSFISLKVCPGITAWRYPPGGLDDDGRRKITAERYVGRPRNVFRRLWWRAYTLTPGVSARLIEDETVQIMERPSIGGFLPLARLVADRQLQAVDAGAGQRQELLREVTKKLRRRMGFVSVYSLGDRRLAQLVDEVFDDAYFALYGRPRPVPDRRKDDHGWVPNDPTDESLGIMSDSESVQESVLAEQMAPERETVSDALRQFESHCGRYWRTVSEMVEQPTWQDFRRMRIEVQEYREESLVSSPLAMRIAADLEVLFDISDQFSTDEKSILYAAASYFVRADDESPDHRVDGLDDDDRVVDAAYFALDLPRE